MNQLSREIMKMCLLALAVVFVFAVSYSSVKAYSVERLIDIANSLEAPFTLTSLRRMEQGILWGVACTNRSSDVVIFNASKKTLRVKYGPSCVDGRVTSGLKPEFVIPSSHSSVYGIESEDDEGVIIGASCGTPFNSSDKKSWLRLSVENLFHDGPHARAHSSEDISVAVELDQGHNNQARFLISDKNPAGPLLTAGSSRQQQRQPKRVHNVFVYVNSQWLLC